MAPAANKVLIIGGGFSGMSAAIQLRKQGIEVDLVEIDQGWRSYGAGISLGGATLRAFKTLGILSTFIEQGAATDGVDLFLPHGQHIGSLPTPRFAGPDVPGGGAIMRPVLARILAEATRAAGANVRLGCSFTALEQTPDSVEVSFSDGQHSSYDLVIGADGLYSSVRAAILPHAPKPQYTGQCVWRAVLPRPPEVERAMMWLGPKIKTGLNPVSKDQMYLFVTEDRVDNVQIDPDRFAAMLSDLLAPFPAPLMQQCRAQLDEHAQIVYRPLESLLVQQPWHQGRVVLIGDAVHATTPHMASGACIGIEDAIVLADEIGKAQSVEAALTEAGALFYRSAKQILENVARAQEAVLDVDAEPRGRLRIATPISMGSSIIAPLIARYQQRFPQVEIEMVLSNGMVDLIEEGIDLAVRVGALPDSGMVARALRPYQNRICGSPEYLALAGTPLQWSDLAKHRCLVHQAWQPEWVTAEGSTRAWPVQQAFSANDGYALRAAALAGAGLILQPEVMLAEAISKGELVIVLDRYVPPPIPVHLLYLQDPYPRRRLASLVDFLVAELS